MTREEIETWVREWIGRYCSEACPVEGINVKARESSPGNWNVQVWQSYDYIQVPLIALLEMAAAFETNDITSDLYGQSGCETCDYGSKYTTTWYVKGATFGKARVDSF